MEKPGTYMCMKCEVGGDGDACWLCGSSEHLEARLSLRPTRPKGMPFWLTIEELIQPDTIKESHAIATESAD